MFSLSIGWTDAILGLGIMLGIIINTKSGKKAYLLQRYYLFDLLKQRGEDYVYRVTQYAGHATELARELAEEQGIRRFLILGGDGTISETINGLMKARIPEGERIQFGIMPRGTGNDYGRFWNLTKDYKKSLDRFFNGTAQPVDIGCVAYKRNGVEHKRYFVNSVGFGIDSKTCLWASILKYYLGSHSFLYAIALVFAVWSHKSKMARLTTDEGLSIEQPLFTMNIGNGPYSGGGIRQNPEADPRDGVFHSMFVLPPTFKQIMKAVPHIFDGKLTELEFIHSYTAKQILLDSPDVDDASGQKMNHMVFEADGILCDACGPYTITCEHHALDIIC